MMFAAVLSGALACLSLTAHDTTTRIEQGLAVARGIMGMHELYQINNESSSRIPRYLYTLTSAAHDLTSIYNQSTKNEFIIHQSARIIHDSCLLLYETCLADIHDEPGREIRNLQYFLPLFESIAGVAATYHHQALYQSLLNVVHTLNKALINKHDVFIYRTELALCLASSAASTYEYLYPSIAILPQPGIPCARCNYDYQIHGDDDCTICREKLSQATTQSGPHVHTPCGHGFHKECLREWLKSSNWQKPCPLCRHNCEFDCSNNPVEAP